MARWISWAAAAEFVKRCAQTELAHNCIGHPLMGLFNAIGWKVTAKWAHDATLPEGWSDA